MPNRIKVTIADNKPIPTIGKGPINLPIYITEEQYELIKSLGYKITKINDSVEKIDTISIEETSTNVKKTVTVEEKPVSEVSSEVVEDETEQVDDVSVEADQLYTKEELSVMTKNELKKILNENKVEYLYNAKHEDLVNLVLELYKK